MQYVGGIIESNLDLIPFDDRFYDVYETIYNECFFEMRNALDVKPYDFYHSIDQLEDKKQNIFLLMKENELIGSVTCFYNEIDDLIVNKKYQGHGYGKKLLMFAINYIQKENSIPITLHVAEWNQKAVSLYKKCGFECTQVEEIVK